VTLGVLELVRSRFASHPGSADAFDWPLTAEDAELALAEFIEHRLFYIAEGVFATASLAAEEATFAPMTGVASGVVASHEFRPATHGSNDARREADAERESDRGALVVCDTRLLEKGYGARLLRALPPMRRLQSPQEMQAWLDELTRGDTRVAC
jgi:hypothetical protein